MHIETFKAENDWVILEHHKHREHKTDSGLFFIESTKWDDVMVGTIKVMSEKVKLPEDVQVGTTVYFFEKDVKSRFHLDAKEYLTIKYLDLLAYR